MNTCKACGCTDRRACDGGCFWVAGLPGPVCSRCVLNALAAAGARLEDDARRQLAGELLVLAGSIDPEIEDMPAFAADDPRSGLEDHFDQFDTEPRLWRPGDPL